LKQEERQKETAVKGEDSDINEDEFEDAVEFLPESLDPEKDQSLNEFEKNILGEWKEGKLDKDALERLSLKLYDNFSGTS